MIMADHRCYPGHPRNPGHPGHPGHSGHPGHPGHLGNPVLVTESVLQDQVNRHFGIWEH